VFDIAQRQSRLDIVGRAREAFESRTVDRDALQPHLTEVSIARNGKKPRSQIRVGAQTGTVLGQPQKRMCGPRSCGLRAKNASRLHGRRTPQTRYNVTAAVSAALR
jgi:hypothetical protein